MKAVARSTYFQIPLCAFAYGRSDVERLNAIMSFGMVEAGRVLWQKRHTQKQRQDLILTSAKSRDVPRDFNPRDERHLFALAGAHMIGVTLASFAKTLTEHKSLEQFRAAFVLRNGPDALVRLKRQFIFEARDGKGITPRELAVLAALFSVIGNKRGPVRITQSRIRCRALGYKTQEVFDCELSRRLDGAKPLSEWQLRSTLDNLTTRKFFRRATYGRRLTYYSHRMGESQFRQALLDMKTYKFSARLLRRVDDENLTANIRNQRAAMMGKPPPAPDAEPLILRPGFLPDDMPLG